MNIILIKLTMQGNVLFIIENVFDKNNTATLYKSKLTFISFQASNISTLFCLIIRKKGIKKDKNI